MNEQAEKRVSGGKSENFLNSIALHQGKEHKSIPLTQGLVALVDHEDFAIFGHLKWTAQVTRTGHVYAYRNIKTDGRQKNVYLHRLILDAPTGFDVDHANHDTLDNRRCNIRLASRSQNSFNRQYPKNYNQSGFHGVSSVPGGKFRGKVSAGRNFFYTPTVTSAEQAARDRDALALRVHGEFAVLNFTL